MKAFLVFALAGCLVLLANQTVASPQFPGIPDMTDLAGKFSQMYGGQMAEKSIEVACKMQEPLQQACGGALEWSGFFSQLTAAAKGQ